MLKHEIMSIATAIGKSESIVELVPWQSGAARSRTAQTSIATLGSAASTVVQVLGDGFGKYQHRREVESNNDVENRRTDAALRIGLAQQANLNALIAAHATAPSEAGVLALARVLKASFRQF